jgi:hypothetical protein
MLTKTIRNFTDDEKEQIRSRQPSAYKQFEEVAMFFIGIYMVPLLCFFGLDKIFHFSSTAQLIFIVFNIFLTLIIMRKIRQKFGTNRPKQVDERMEVFHVKTSRAIKREEYEDLGDAFYVEVEVEGQQKTLFLCGQHFYELIEDKKFPNTEFEVLRKVGEPNTFDIKLCGTYFEPERVLPRFDKKTWKEGSFPYDLDILDKTVDQIN